MRVDRSRRCPLKKGLDLSTLIPQRGHRSRCPLRSQAVPARCLRRGAAALRCRISRQCDDRALTAAVFSLLSPQGGVPPQAGRGVKPWSRQRLDPLRLAGARHLPLRGRQGNSPAEATVAPLRDRSPRGRQRVALLHRSHPSATVHRLAGETKSHAGPSGSGVATHDSRLKTTFTFGRNSVRHKAWLKQVCSLMSSAFLAKSSSPSGAR